MIPKVELMYNYDYAKKLYRGAGNYEDIWRRVVGLGADFEKIYNEYIEYILVNIEKYSGFAWQEHAEVTFPVYLADVDVSFAHPLTLKVDDDPEVMLTDLIVQLSNRNMFFGFTDDDGKIKCFRSITNKILNDLKIVEIEADDFDLAKKTIKEYIKK
ncbi:MAG: hypothetical protein ACNFW9_06330 [Candidatus Kerfeldbacteria bacterium]|jgi:hypothetical protein